MKHHYLTLILAMCMSLLPFAQGYAQDSETYSEDFGSGSTPGGWILDAGITYNGELYSATKGTSASGANLFNNAACAITPKLRFAEGEKLQFQAKRDMRNSSYSAVKICWSPDRTNWQEVATVTSYRAGGTVELQSNYNYQDVEVSMPEGEGYVGFFINVMYIDNVKGGTLVPVDFDAYVSSVDMDTKATVNTLYTPTMTISNLGNAVDASSYTAALYAAPKTDDDSDLAFEKICDITPVDMPAQSIVELSAAWMPHAVGSYVMYMSMTRGEDVLTTGNVNVTVREESASVEYTIGVPGVFSNGKSVPIDLNYYKAESQVVYSQAILESYGIKPGMKIGGVKYKGYYQYGAIEKDLNGVMRVGIQPWDSETVTTSNYAEFTSYLGTQSEYNRSAGTATDPIDFIDITFDTPFVYEGGNIIVATIRHESDNCNPYHFEYMECAEDRAIYRKIDSGDLDSKTYSRASAVPVPYFTVINEPATVSGEVTYKEEAVAGAVVTLESDGVIYSGTADEQGHYSISVVQSDRIYNVTATAEGHPEFKGEETVSFAEGDVTYNIAFGEWPFVSGVVTTAAGEKAAEAAVVLSIDDLTFAATTDEQGAYKVLVDRHDATFNVSVDYAKAPIYAGTVDVADADVTNDIQLADFTKERLYTLNIAVTDVRGESLDGVAYTLKSDNFDETYPAEETKLDAEGKSTVTVYGGANTFTLTMAGMKTLEVTVDVNKTTDLTLTLTEDVNVPEIKGFEIDHDVMTGENDVLVWWNEDLPVVEEEDAEAPARSAANPAEKFIISLDGEEVGETESYYYVLENIGTGAHEISVVAKYDVAQSEAATTTVTINADDYVKVTFNITTNNEESTDGLMLAIAEKAEDGDEYEIQVLHGVVEIPYLPKGTYLVEMEAPAAYSYTAWDARELTFTEETTVDIEFEEVLGAPADLKAEAAQNTGTEHFNIDLAWGHEEGFNGKVQSYDILLDGEKVASTPDKNYTLTQVAAGAHTVGVCANYISGASEVTEQNVNLVSGIDGIDAEGETGDVYTPAGLLIKRDATLKEVKTLPAGLYIFRGRKVVVK